VGCQVVCEAVNGKEGLEKAMKYRPDIIITDITMPVMDGIEMAERVRDLLSGVRIIFLTCHEDFFYARQALKLNITDYLVKETMARKELYALLEKTGKEILLERELQDRTHTIAKEFDENRMLVGELIINELIDGNVSDYNTLEKRLDFYNYRLKDRCYQLSVLKVEKHIGLTKEDIGHLSALCKSIIYNTINDILKRHYCGEVFLKSQCEFVIVYFVHEYTPKTEDMIGHISREILEALNTKIQKCTIYIGEAFDSLQKLPGAYEKIKLLEDKRFYVNNAPILYHHILAESFSDDAHLRTGFLENYKEALNVLDVSMLEAAVKTFVEKARLQNNDVRKIKNTIGRAFAIMTDTLEKYGCGYGLISSIPYNDIIVEAPDIFVLSNVLLEFSIKAIDYSRRNADALASFEIKKIIQYINLHLGESLTLDSMAQLANMNSSYFSRYFKAKTGEKFVDYLSCVRVEKAKQLLRETGLTLDEILEKVGHVNKGYFIKVFKKAFGMSPTEYRRNCKHEYIDNLSKRS
jgi:YesN/AraC family two-component response regulator